MSCSAAAAPPRARWFVRGDVDGFFGLALDNLVQLLLIDSLCRGVVGLPDELVRGRILPGAAVSLLVGNLYYSWQALRLARAEGRADRCALPYGINTVSLFAYVFLVMLPARLAAERLGLPDPPTIAWRAGLAAAFGAGLIETFGAFVAPWLKRVTPRAALLSTLAGVALGFIGLGFLFRTFARPLIGFTTLAIVLLTYFGRVRFRGGLPGGLVAVAVGAVIAHLTGLAPPLPDAPLAWHAPTASISALFAALREGALLDHFAVIVPMGLFALIGSLQNLESAEAAGDTYPVKRSLAVNGIGTLVAALCGSCFPTTLYIGHPGWKALGARVGYSALSGVVMAALCCSGALALVASFVPIDAGMAIVLWIGLVITAQAFQATPREHAPAVVVGLLPGVAAWGVLLAKQGLQIGGATAAVDATQSGAPLGPAQVDAFLRFDTWIAGGFALEQGFILSSMVLAALTVAVIERKFVRAALWCVAGAALSACGLLHSWRFAGADAVLALAPAWPFVGAYLAMGACFLAAPFLTRPHDDAGH
ncbi:MAG: NCS2 family permease [Planctomycetes bacterium]|nr:NCS2 family permease [Planctomycetota bacterium]